MKNNNEQGPVGDLGVFAEELLALIDAGRLKPAN